MGKSSATSNMDIIPTETGKNISAWAHADLFRSHDWNPVFVGGRARGLIADSVPRKSVTADCEPPYPRLSHFVISSLSLPLLRDTC